MSSIPYSTIQIEKERGCLVMRLNGTLDYAVGEDMVSRVRSGVEEYRNVVIDLEQVDYIDNSGLGSLVTVQIALKRQGHSLVISGLNGGPLDVVKSSRLMKIFQIRESVDMALGEIGNQLTRGDKSHSNSC